MIKKEMSYWKQILLNILCICFLLILTPLAANELSITSYVDKTTIGVDDILKLTVEISGTDASKVDKYELPDISGFTVTGSSSSSSSSFSIVGGRMTSSINRSHNYTLRASNTGVFLIPPLSIQFKNQTYTTDPIRITVVEGTTEPPPPVSRQFRSQETDSLTDNIFIIAEVPKQSVYLGEPLIVNYKIYSRYDLANLSFVSEPNFIGFWKDDIFFANRMNFQRENYQGILYNSMLLRTIALYPNQTGTLIVPAFSITADIVIRARSFWEFDSTRKINLESEPIDIAVKEIPATNRPADFFGAVGNYSMTANLNQTQIDVGDPLTITLNIKGSGNLKHFNYPQLNPIPSVRYLDPEVTTETRIENRQVVGTKTIRYPAIITQSGTIEIPPIVFSYFNPANERFHNLSSNPFIITAEDVSFPIITSGHSQQDISVEGFDIFYIHRTANLNGYQLLLSHWLFWIIGVLIFLTLPISYLYSKERNRVISDKNHLRQRLAKKILKKYLRLATERAKSGDMSFYNSAVNGLCNYLTDVLKISRGSTLESILTAMENKKYNPDCIQKVKNIINRCLEARFKPGGFDKEKIDSDYQELIAVVSQLINARKGKSV